MAARGGKGRKVAEHRHAWRNPVMLDGHELRLY
jgi:hypothetical protein